MATRFARLLAAVLAGVLATGAALTAGQANPKIAQRDQLVVTVVGPASKDFSNKYPVGIDGAIEFPQLGRLVVAGLTTRELSDLLVKKLKDADILLNPQVTVELEQTATKKVTVNGSVRTQGAVAFAGELTLLDALVRAGGRLPDAADEVLVVRSPTMFEINVRDLENGLLARNIVLQDGDAVFVRKAQAVTITGYVRNVGAYNIEPGSTVEQALALAGGVTPQGSEKRIEVSRKVDGKIVILKNVKKTDVVKPGDVIKIGARILSPASRLGIA